MILLSAAEVLQNRSLGEYGSGWEWDNTDTLAFDQETIIIDPSDSRISHVSPIRYITNGSAQSTCLDNMAQTNGEMLFSGSIMQ